MITRPTEPANKQATIPWIRMCRKLYLVVFMYNSVIWFASQSLTELEVISDDGLLPNRLCNTR